MTRTTKKTTVNRQAQNLKLRDRIDICGNVGIVTRIAFNGAGGVVVNTNVTMDDVDRCPRHRRQGETTVIFPSRTHKVAVLK